MPVSVVCDAASVNAAIRDSIASSSTNNNSCSGQNDDHQQSLQSKLVASAKRVLLTKIEYEEVNNYNQSLLDTFKSKYIVLKPSTSSGKSNLSNTIDKETNQNVLNAENTSNITTVGSPYGPKDVQLPNPKKILFPREKVQIGWRSSNRKWHVGAGMVNVGNTCYLNSTLQALFHVPAMANWLMSDSVHREKCEEENGTQGGCIICAMSKTLICSQTNQCPIRPHLVYTKLKLVCKHLTMGRQEDAHEFLRYLVEAMEKAYLLRFRNSKELDQFSKETTPLNQILGGYLRSAVRCLACGHVSTTFQHFEDLLLDIRKANTIEEALDGYFARERLEDMGYKCESCKKKVAATKQFSLERAPISLCIQLKRFSMMGTKLNKHVAIRTRLDLTPYASKKNSEQLTYRLVAMVTHLGASQHCGHYTAIGLTESGTYYQFDDSCVRALTMQNVLNTNAYIIFYELEDSQQRSRQTSTITSREYYEQLKDTTANNKINGQSENNENSQQRLYSTTSTNSSNTVLSLNSKALSKLEASSSSAFIGPQLPDKAASYKDDNECHSTTNMTASTSINGDTPKNKQNGFILNNSTSKLVNPANKILNKQNTIHSGSNNTSHSQVSSSSSSSPSSSAIKQFPTPSQRANQNLVDRLIIHLKSGGGPPNNNINNNSSSNSGGNSSSSTSSNNKELNDYLSKHVATDKYRHDSNTESQLKNGDLIQNNNNNTNNKLNLLNTSTKTDSKDKNQIKNRRSQTPTYVNGNYLESVSPIKSPSSYVDRTKNLIRSLVPYESDDEDERVDNDEDVIETDDSDTVSGSNKKDSRKNSITIKRNNKINNSYNSDNDSSSSFESFTSGSRKKLTTPSPPVIDSKTGFWQVETISTPNKLSTSSASSTSSTSEKKNPFSSPPQSTISPNNFYSNNSSKHENKDKKSNNNYKSNNNNNPEGDTGLELTKLSHRGYGAPVLSWNGHQSNMEKEINEEKRNERKRKIAEDEENEMDRGKQKKIKIHGPIGRDNPGYNPFQEYQNQYQNNNRRWNNGHSNGNNRYHNNHLYRQNAHHHHHHRNHNNFRRHRFHQRSHHQRNGENNLYHRRDS